MVNVQRATMELWMHAGVRREDCISCSFEKHKVAFIYFKLNLELVNKTEVKLIQDFVFGTTSVCKPKAKLLTLYLYFLNFAKNL